MPNWIEGSLKLRGDYDNILKFWKNGIHAYTYSNKSHDPIEYTENWYELDEYETGAYIYLDLPANAWLYISETKRAFVNDDNAITIPIVKFDPPSKEAVMAIPIRQAWGFQENDWSEIAKTYCLELKLFGIESGIGFWHSFEVLNDGIIPLTKNECHVYQDYCSYIWNSPFPWMGG